MIIVHAVGNLTRVVHEALSHHLTHLRSQAIDTNVTCRQPAWSIPRWKTECPQQAGINVREVVEGRSTAKWKRCQQTVNLLLEGVMQEPIQPRFIVRWARLAYSGRYVVEQEPISSRA